MNTSRVLCWLGRHDYTEWWYGGECEPDSDHVHHIRRCQRCPKGQQMIARKDDGKPVVL